MEGRDQLQRQQWALEGQIERRQFEKTPTLMGKMKSTHLELTVSLFLLEIKKCLFDQNSTSGGKPLFLS